MHTIRSVGYAKLFGARAASLVAAMALSVISLVGSAAPISAASYDDCAVRVLGARTYVFVSLDNPDGITDGLLWDVCSQMVQGGYAQSISTRTPMASAGNQLVCSADAGSAHMHVWSGSDAFSTQLATEICDRFDPALVTWWPLS